MVYFICWSIALLFFKIYLGFEVIGRENVPKKGAFIFASNHSSYLDPIILGTSVYRSLNYMARYDLFKRTFFGWLMRSLHSFPVRRHDNNFDAVKKSLRILKEGKGLVIFPEGTRSKDGHLKKVKPGIGFIVAKSKVPVLPAYVEGSFDALPKGLDTLKRHPIKLYIGEAMDFTKENLNTNDRDIYRKISDDIMKRIAELRDENKNG